MSRDAHHIESGHIVGEDKWLLFLESERIPSVFVE